MTDLVERLRHASLQTDFGLDIDKELMDEGWREIERLRALTEELAADINLEEDHRAEIERLRAECNELREAWNTLAVLEREEAAEIERLRAYAAHERRLGAEGPMIELIDARQEIERLQARVEVFRPLAAENDKLQAEVERLRAELERANDPTEPRPPT